MFDKGKRGSDLVPDYSVVLCAPHKNLSGFHTSDIDSQLCNRGIDSLILCGMSANLCVESHLRDAEERGFVVNDATAAAGPDAYKAALTNYMFIAHESIDTEEALKRLGEAS